MKSLHKMVAALLATMTVAGCSHSDSTKSSANAVPMTVQDVNAAQQGWCDALLSIAETHAAGGDYKTVAAGVLENNYNYDYNKVLFNPTLTFGEQTFRLDKEGAAAYFIGGNPKYPNDNGFALKPWVACRYTNAGGDNAGVLIEDDIAITMGNVYLIDAKGKETVVDKLWVFKRDPDGRLRIIAHKSAIPNPVPAKN